LACFSFGGVLQHGSTSIFGHFSLWQRARDVEILQQSRIFCIFAAK
jgi:hypothetical protein